MAKLTLTDISNITGAESTAISNINANGALIETALENTLSRDGTTPNTMSADLDMNSNKVINVTDPTANQDAATKAYVDSIVTTAGYITVKDEGSNLTTALASIDFVGSGVTATTSGNDVTVTISAGSIDINGLTAETTTDTVNDYIPFYDASAAANRKFTIGDIVTESTVVGSLNGATLTSITPASTDEVLVLDASDSSNLKSVPWSDVVSAFSLTIKEEGSNLTTAATSIDFVGNGITASNSGGAVTVTLANEVSINAQTGTSYTTVLSDSGKIITMSNASANTLTIPTNASVAYPTGTVINVVMLGAGTTSIAGATGVTLNGVSAGSGDMSATYGSASLLKIGTDTWVVSGSIGTVA